jgi:acetyltransferase-like isoleucine patch superfamily enzyme
MGNRTWTIFGAGNLIGDFIDAVESRSEQVEYVVLNLELDEKILGKIPASIKIVKLSEFEPPNLGASRFEALTDFNFFGFVDPNKKPFLDSLKKYNLTFSNLVHEFSYLPKNIKMGQGNYIGAGVVLASNVVLGDFNYINRMASIGHDTRVRDFNEFGPGCTVAGNCSIGSRNHFFSGSVLINNITIRDEVVVGAGGVVIKDTPESGTYIGVPVKKIK